MEKLVKQSLEVFLQPMQDFPRIPRKFEFSKQLLKEYVMDCRENISELISDRFFDSIRVRKS